MDKKWILPIAAFVLTCLCGLFVALAGGTQWGTSGAGLAAAMTLFIATALAGMVAAVLSGSM